jgi:hypothetical protein
MLTNTLKTMFVLTFISAFALTATAQMQSNHDRITTSVLSGAGAPRSSGSFQTHATLGQPSPLMDPSDPPYSTNYDNYPGFWYTVGASPPVNDCSGDFNNDGDVDGSDLATFAEEFGRTDCAGDCEGDFNGDNDVDGSDLATFATDFGRTDCLK